MSGSRAKQIKKQLIESAGRGNLPWTHYVVGNGGERVNAGFGGAYRKAKHFYKRLHSL